MKTILVPTDFSHTAINATNYAIDFAKQMRIDRIILFNAWQPITFSDPMSTLIMTEIESIKFVSSNGLEKESKRLKEICPIHIKIDTVSEMASIDSGVATICDKGDISYIIMGITGGSEIEQKLIGSNTISVSQNNKVPVIIVPSSCKYQFISKAMFLCDFKNIDSNFPEQQLVNFLEVAMPELEVVNFDPDFTREQEEPALEKFALNQILRKYAPKYKYSLRNDFEDAVNEFAENDNVQLIINVSKKHSWFYNILHPSYTKKLAFHTKVPLMVIHA